MQIMQNGPSAKMYIASIILGLILAGCGQKGPEQNIAGLQAQKSRPATENAAPVSPWGKKAPALLDSRDKSRYVFGDVVNLRKQASASADIVGKVKLGEVLNLLQNSPEIEADGHRWVKVQHGKSTAFVAQDLLAMAGLEYAPGRYALFGGIRSTNAGLRAELRQFGAAGQAMHIIPEIPIGGDQIAGLFTTAAVLPASVGLPAMLRVEVAYPACGYPATASYFYFNPQRELWQYAFKTESVSEGGVFQDAYTVALPKGLAFLNTTDDSSESAPTADSPEQIVLQRIYREFDEAKEQYIVKKTYPKQVYAWTGQAFEVVYD